MTSEFAATPPLPIGPPGSAFRFFGRHVVVTSDDAGVLDVLDAVYSRQRAPMPAAGIAPDVAVRIVSRAPGSIGPDGGAPVEPGSKSAVGAPAPRIEVAGRTVRVPAADQLVHYAHLVLINAAASLVQDGLVLHTGAVARNGRAVLLVGHSGRGKTTLSLELVRRGWRFLSDDFAALGSDGTVQPFPRRVNLTDASLDLLGLSPPPGTPCLATFAGVRKWMVDVEDLFPGALSGPLPLAALVLLDPPPALANHGSGASRGAWRLQVDHLPAGFAEALAGLPGVTAVDRCPSDEAVVIDLQILPGAHVVGHLDALCARHDVAVLGARRLAGSSGRQDDAPGDAGVTWAIGEPGLAPLRGPESLAPLRAPERLAPLPAPERLAPLRGPESLAPLTAPERLAPLRAPERLVRAVLMQPVPPDRILPDVLRHALSLSGARFLGRTGDAEVLHAITCLRGALGGQVKTVRLAPAPLSEMADAVERLASDGP